MPYVLQDLQTIGKNSIRILFESVQLANAFLINTTSWDTLKIEVRIPKSLIFKHAVVYGVHIGMPEQEITMEIDPAYKVVRVYKMSKTIKQQDNTFQRVPTKFVHLVFQRKSLPTRIVIHFVRLELRPKINTIVQCRNCMKYNHPFSVCRSKQLCSKCNRYAHKGDCIEPPKCIF